MTGTGGPKESDKKVVEIPWSFLDEEKGTPDLLKIDPKEAEKFINGLPISEEQKTALIKLIIEERAKKR